MQVFHKGPKPQLQAGRCAAATHAFTVARYLPDDVASLLVGASTASQGMPNPLCFERAPEQERLMQACMAELWKYFRGNPLSPIVQVDG